MSHTFIPKFLVRWSKIFLTNIYNANVFFSWNKVEHASPPASKILLLNSYLRGSFPMKKVDGTKSWLLTSTYIQVTECNLYVFMMAWYLILPFMLHSILTYFSCNGMWYRTVRLQVWASHLISQIVYQLWLISTKYCWNPLSDSVTCTHFKAFSVNKK